MTPDKDTQDGTIGFGPQVAGRAKAAHSHTASFGRGLPENEKLPAHGEITAGQEEGGRLRMPADSAAGRIIPQEEDALPEGNENAKDPHWKVPVDLPSVKPEDYDKSVPSGRGSAAHEDSAQKEQKKRGQLPLHNEPVGGR